MIEMGANNFNEGYILARRQKNDEEHREVIADNFSIEKRFLQDSIAYIWIKW